VLHVWNREIRIGYSSVKDPSETVRALLRQEKERKKAPTNHQDSAVATELSELKEIMISLTKT
jgi:hypothetical protein